jgi:hypothetical protein
MQNTEFVFTAVAKIESDVTTSWGDSTLGAKLAALSGAEASQIKTNKTLVSSSLLALGLVGGVINKEIAFRKSQKLVDGGAYVMIDLMAQQIALKSQLANLISASSNGARWEGFVMNLRELVIGASKLESLGSQLEGYGQLASAALKGLSSGMESAGIMGALRHEVAALAA